MSNKWITSLCFTWLRIHSTFFKLQGKQPTYFIFGCIFFFSPSFLFFRISFFLFYTKTESLVNNSEMCTVLSYMIIYRWVKSKLSTQGDNRLNYFPFPDDVLRIRSELNSIKCKIGRKSTGRVVRVKFVISISLKKVIR